MATFDDLTRWYDDLYELSVPLAFDDTLSQVVTARREVQERLDRKNETIAKLRQRAGLGEAAASEESAPGAESAR